MPLKDTVGLLELSSIAKGYQAEDAMLKAAPVELVLARTICSGKYLIAVSGDVASVQAAVESGAEAASGALIEKGVITRIHPSLFPAMAQSVQLAPGQVGALGVIETFSAASIIEASDAAVKEADVTPFRLHLAMAVGGKGFVLLTGKVGDVQAAVAAGAEQAGKSGMLVSSAVIPAPSKELMREYI